MTDLKKQMERARKSETFKGKPTAKKAKARKAATKPSPKAEPEVADYGGELTANERARQAAGIDDQPARTAAQRQADRRRKLAQLAVEVTAEEKAELLMAARDNGRTLKAEVHYRLFGK